MIAATDASGAALSINAYDEHGVPAASNQGRFQYTGQMYLPEAQLYHYRARAYDPALGRFLQSDPILYAGGLNLYAYVQNDPVNWRDPYGLWTFQVGVGGNAGAGGFTALGGFGAAWDSSGGFGFYTYGGGGVTTGAVADGGVSVQITNALTIDDLAGPFQYYGVSAGDAFAGSVDIVGGDSPNGNVVGFGGTRRRGRRRRNYDWDHQYQRIQCNEFLLPNITNSISRRSAH